MGLDGRMKYLAMRAKKMTARMKRLPTADALRANFIRKGTEITKRESEVLLEEVRNHRIKMRASGSATSKPTKKLRVSQPKTYSRAYGR